MLAITPYLWVVMVVVVVLGPFYPLLGYVVPVVFAAAFISSVGRGRWMCGNLCPRGSFNDYVLAKVSRHKSIMAWLRSLWIRIPVFAAMMAFMGWRLTATQGLVEKIGMVFVSMCIATTAVAVLAGIAIHPRTWCTFCPMGTAQRFIGGGKQQVIVSPALCTDCSLCEKACPMGYTDIGACENKDCLLCDRCIATCPKNALSRS